MQEQRTPVVTQETAKAMPVRCHISSYTPEIHNFYGDADSVVAKMDRVDMGLTERRMFMLSVESTEGAELKLFEHIEGNLWAISGWTGGSADGAPAKISEMIFDNQGKLCVGKSTQALLDDMFGVFELLGNVEVSDSGTAVFGHIVRAHADKGYLRVTAGLLC